MMEPMTPGATVTVPVADMDVPPAVVVAVMTSVPLQPVAE